jgi:hypothetical protein
MNIDKQVRTHHFVVTATVYEDGSVSWFVDDDTLVARFPEGAIFDEKTNEWLDKCDITEDISEEDEALAESLTLTFGNTRNQMVTKFEKF